MHGSVSADHFERALEDVEPGGSQAFERPTGGLDEDVGSAECEA